jgi:hypothetical protein
MHIENTNQSNAFLAGVAGFFAFVSGEGLWISIVLPIGLFMAGKLIDIAVRIYLFRKGDLEHDHNGRV